MIRSTAILADLGSGSDTYVLPEGAGGGHGAFRDSYARDRHPHEIGYGPYSHHGTNFGFLLDTGGRDRYTELLRHGRAPAVGGLEGRIDLAAARARLRRSTASTPSAWEWYVEGRHDPRVHRLRPPGRTGNEPQTSLGRHPGRRPGRWAPPTPGSPPSSRLSASTG